MASWILIVATWVVGEDPYPHFIRLGPGLWCMIWRNQGLLTASGQKSPWASDGRDGRMTGPEFGCGEPPRDFGAEGKAPRATWDGVEARNTDWCGWTGVLQRLSPREVFFWGSPAHRGAWSLDLADQSTLLA